MRVFLYIGLLLFFTACVQHKQADNFLHENAFPLKQFLTDQIAYLNQQNPEVVKTVQTGNKQPEVKQLTDLNWSKELEAFQEIDLSKPALTGVYEVSDSVFGAFSIKTYQKRPKENALVQKMVIKTDTITGERFLEAMTEQDNLLYFSRKILQLHIATQQDEPRLVDYSVKGTQKIIFTDSLYYNLHAILKP